MSEDDSDEFPQDWFTDLMADLSMHLRRKTAASLLCGNDAQCFTTQQYMERWVRDRNKGFPTLMKGDYGLELARKHLKSLQMLEVKPDVWAEFSVPALLARIRSEEQS